MDCFGHRLTGRSRRFATVVTGALVVVAGSSAFTFDAIGAATVGLPVAYKTLIVRVAAGSVGIRLPGQATFSALPHQAAIPLGTTIDTTRGTVVLTAATAKLGITQSGRFYGGVFRVSQRAGTSALQPGQGKVVITTLTLVGSLQCSAGQASAAARRRHPRRYLWGSDSGGNWGEYGHNASASTIHTRWLVEDYCGGSTTVVKVVRGLVAVRCGSRGISDTPAGYLTTCVERKVLVALHNGSGKYRTVGRYSASTVRG